MQSASSTIQSYPLGEKSIRTFNQYYTNYLSPFLSNFSGPYSYIAPYILKADKLADSGLKKVDNTVPLITKEPQEIKTTLLDYAYSPLRLAHDGKTYVLSTYDSEYRKCGGQDKGSSPLISGSKAALTTSLVVTSDFLAKVSQAFSASKAQGQDFASQKYAQGSQYVGQGLDYANGKKEEAVAYVSETAEKAKNLAYAEAEKAKSEGEKLKSQAKAKAGK